VPKYRKLEQGQVLPEDWLDALQEFIGVGSFDFLLEIASNTSIKVDAGPDDEQTSCAIMGRWRWNVATVTAAMPGTPPPGNYDVYVTGSENLFAQNLTPPPDEADLTTYAFGLQIVTSGVPTTDLYRKVGYVIWDGTKIIRVVQLIGTGFLIAHGPTHDPGASDPVDWPVVFLYGLVASRPTAAEWNRGLYFYATDVAGGTLYQSIGTSWVKRSPSLIHAAEHQPGGSDPLTWTLINLAGTLASRPAASASNLGLTYLATDDRGGTVYRSNGTTWVQMAASVMHKLQHAPGQSDAIDYTVVHMWGTLAARPAAAAVNAGLFYLATDAGGGTLYLSTGTAWIQAAASVSVAVPGAGIPLYLGMDEFPPIPVFEGLEVYLVVFPNTLWHLRWRNPAASFKATGGWEVVGQDTPVVNYAVANPPAQLPVLTTTPSPIVTVDLPLNGTYRFDWGVIGSLLKGPTSAKLLVTNQLGVYGQGGVGYENAATGGLDHDPILEVLGESMIINTTTLGGNVLYAYTSAGTVQPNIAWIRAFPIGNLTKP
jgi:hypothetical protein